MLRVGLIRNSLLLLPSNSMVSKFLSLSFQSLTIGVFQIFRVWQRALDIVGGSLVALSVFILGRDTAFLNMSSSDAMTSFPENPVFPVLSFSRAYANLYDILLISLLLILFFYMTSAVMPANSLASPPSYSILASTYLVSFLRLSIYFSNFSHSTCLDLFTTSIFFLPCSAFFTISSWIFLFSRQLLFAFTSIFFSSAILAKCVYFLPICSSFSTKFLYPVSNSSIVFLFQLYFLQQQRMLCFSTFTILYWSSYSAYRIYTSLLSNFSTATTCECFYLFFDFMLSKIWATDYSNYIRQSFYYSSLSICSMSFIYFSRDYSILALTSILALMISSSLYGSLTAAMPLGTNQASSYLFSFCVTRAFSYCSMSLILFRSFCSSSFVLPSTSSNWAFTLVPGYEGMGTVGVSSFSFACCLAYTAQLCCLLLRPPQSRYWLRFDLHWLNFVFDGQLG